VVLSLDPAASEFYEDGAYVLAKSDKSRKSSAEMVEFWAGWDRRSPRPRSHAVAPLGLRAFVTAQPGA
jgi:hypothetical protein